MARLLTCGFELNSATAGVEITGVTGAGGVSISTTTVRSGTYALRVNNSNTTNTGPNWTFATAAAGPFYARTYFRVTTLPNVDTGIMGFLGGIAQMMGFVIRTTGVLGCYYTASSAYDHNIADSSFALRTGQWYRLEMKYTGTAGSGIAEFYVDGNLITSATGLTFATATISALYLGANIGLTGGNAATYDFFYDDIAVNDGNGSNQASYPGPGQCVLALPNADGDNHGWKNQAGSAGTPSNYTLVNDFTVADGTAYIERVSPSNQPIDDYKVTSPTTLGISDRAQINCIVIMLRGGATSNTANAGRDVETRIKSAASGTVSQVSASVQTMNTTTWVTHSTTAPAISKQVSYTDPTTAKAWTVTGTNSLTNMQIGVTTETAATTEVHVTFLGAYIEYVFEPPPNYPLRAYSQARNRGATR